MLQLNKFSLTQKDIENMFDGSWFTHAQIFDDVLLISNKSTNCIVLKTSEGLILMDAIFPKKEMFDAIVDAISDIGWNPKDIKKFIISHGHFDHTGCGKWIKKAFNPEIYMSEIDYHFWREKPFFPDKPETHADFEIHNFVGEGDEITLGDKTIKVFFTPGHTPGGLSFIFPVYDLGTKHVAAIWGGTNPPNNIKEVVVYFRSVDHFLKQTDKYNVDVALSTHQMLMENGLERMDVARKRFVHMPNPYVLCSNKGYREYAQLFRNMCYDRLETM
ncbi:MAG: MBL fold metallo-hydrolase [Eubacteriaceae bacterium]|nr:MBL fold metallo-hydrolase [Eubacteriaceae bacterium]